MLHAITIKQPDGVIITLHIRRSAVFKFAKTMWRFNTVPDILKGCSIAADGTSPDNPEALARAEEAIEKSLGDIFGKSTYQRLFGEYRPFTPVNNGDFYVTVVIEAIVSGFSKEGR